MGDVFIDGEPGRVAVGLEYDNRCGLLFVAGGATGQGYVYDAATGDPIATLQFTAPGSFVNDVTVTAGAAYFTESQQAALYRVGLVDCTPSEPVVTIPLAGEWTQVPGFNANGIVSDPSGKRLIVVNSTTGGLFNVDPTTGTAGADRGAAGNAGDGLLLRGRTLYVVQNRLNQIAVVALDPGWESGRARGGPDRRQLRRPDHHRPFRERVLRRERTIHDPADTQHPVSGRTRRGGLSISVHKPPRGHEVARVRRVARQQFGVKRVDDACDRDRLSGRECTPWRKLDEQHADLETRRSTRGSPSRARRSEAPAR